MQLLFILKKNKDISFTITWMNLEYILTDKSPSQMNKYCTIPLIRYLKYSDLQKHRVKR